MSESERKVTLDTPAGTRVQLQGTGILGRLVDPVTIPPWSRGVSSFHVWNVLWDNRDRPMRARCDHLTIVEEAE